MGNGLLGLGKGAAGLSAGVGVGTLCLVDRPSAEVARSSLSGRRCFRRRPFFGGGVVEVDEEEE